MEGLSLVNFVLSFTISSLCQQIFNLIHSIAADWLPISMALFNFFIPEFSDCVLIMNNRLGEVSKWP